MPELPEVESARLYLEDRLPGRTVTSMWAAQDDIVLVDGTPDELGKLFAGHAVVSLHRKGKHLWIRFEDAPCLCIHLGMTGSFQDASQGTDRPRFCKLAFELDDDSSVYFINKRRLGRIRVRQDPEREPPIDSLGWDPLKEKKTAAAFFYDLQSRNAVLKGLLLNQSFIAGIGNWIADEVLFQARIHPARRASSLSREESDQLLKSIRHVIRRAVKVKADDRRFPSTWLFHHRWGKNQEARISTGDPIHFSTIAGRTTAWVPAVQ